SGFKVPAAFYDGDSRNAASHNRIKPTWHWCLLRGDKAQARTWFERSSGTITSWCSAAEISIPRQCGPIQCRVTVMDGGAMNRRTMMTTLAGGVVAVGCAGRAEAAPAADGKLPVASADAAKDFPGARELPDPSTNYKVVFSVSA